MNKLILFILLSLFMSNLYAQDVLKIDFELKNFEKDTMYVGYYLGDNQYVLDTVSRQNNKFSLEIDSLLPAGVYMLVLPPKNDIIQFIMPEKDQQFSISMDINDNFKDVKVKGSEENEIYFEYLKHILEVRPIVDALKVKRDSAKTKEEKDQLTEEITKNDKLVFDYVEDIYEKHPESVTGNILIANKQIDIPKFEGVDESKVKMERFQYYRAHHFDYIHMDKPALLRSPFLFDRVEYYIDKLVYKHPDSITEAIDYILEKMEPAPVTFQYYLVHFLNQYARSKYVGLDAVYVHIVDKYYATGLAPWTKEKQLKKIIKNANELRSTLVGKQAPEIKLENQEGETINLSDIDAEYTVLYFYKYSCGHCKKSTPKLIDFYKNYQDKGVKVVAICTKFQGDIPKCWEYVESVEGMDILYTLVDPFHKSKFMVKYNVTTTPKIFVLDKDKKILSKGIGAEQLPKVLDLYLQEKEVVK